MCVTSANATTDALTISRRLMTATSRWLLLILRRPRFARGDAVVEVLLIDRVVVQPHVRHVVDGAIPPANPVRRVVVVLVARRIVVPRDDVKNRPRGQERLRVVCVGVGTKPPEVEPIDAAQGLGLDAARPLVP